MALREVKTINLYDVRRLRPNTLQAIIDAEDGAWVPVDQAEQNAIVSIQVLESDVVDALAVRNGEMTPDDAAEKRSHRAAVKKGMKASAAKKRAAAK